MASRDPDPSSESPNDPPTTRRPSDPTPDLSQAFFSASDPLAAEIRRQIEKEGAASTFYDRLRKKDALGILMTIETSSHPIPIDAGFLREDLAALKEPRIIEALIRSGLPLLTEPDLYLAIIQADGQLHEGEEPELVKALLKHGLGPRRLEGALSEACGMHAYHLDYSPPLNLRVVELLLAAGANVDEKDAEPLRFAITYRHPQLTKLLCAADKYGAAIRRVSVDLGRAGEQGMEDLLFLLEALDLRQRYEALEHAFNGALNEPEEFLVRLIRLGAKGYRLPLNTLPPLYLNEFYTHQSFLVERLGIRGCRPLMGLPYDHPPIEHLSQAIKASDMTAVRQLMESNPSLREEQSHPVELAAWHGDLQILRYFIEDLSLNANENEGTPLIVASQQGWVDILEYLLSKGADFRAQNHEPLVRASQFVNAEVVRILLDFGADVRVANDYPVYICARNSDYEKRGPALESAKHLVEHGANPRVFGLPLDLDKGPAPTYLFLMSEVMDPSSTLYIQYIDSRVTKEHLNFQDPSYRRSHAFKYISNCAAVAASLGDISIARDFFRSFLRDGAHKVLFERRGRFKDLADASSKELDGYQDLEDIGLECAIDLLLPMLASQSPEHIEQATRSLEAVHILSAVEKHLYPEAVRILFKDRPLLDILRLNKLWHRPDKRMPLEAHPLRKDASWYPLIADTDLSNGYSIHPLTDNKALAREGSALYHCVGKGSYASACLTGETHLLSLRFKSEPVATIQFSDSKGRETKFPLSNGRFVALKQFRGAYNSLPSPGATRAFLEFTQLARSNRGTLQGEALGETDESKSLRAKRSISAIESVTGIGLKDFPRDAFRHYCETISIFATKRYSGTQSERMPLLRPAHVQLSQKTIKAFFDELSTLRDNLGPYRRRQFLVVPNDP